MQFQVFISQSYVMDQFVPYDILIKKQINELISFVQFWVLVTHNCLLVIFDELLHILNNKILSVVGILLFFEVKTGTKHLRM
jgi:hypothetical protein